MCDFDDDPRRTQSSAWGLAALAEAELAIGQGEEGGNNRGPFVRSVLGPWLNREGGPYCAAACYTWIERGAARLDRACTIDRTHSARQLWQRVLDAGGRKVALPCPGDFALYRRPGGHHIWIVQRIRGRAVIGIEANRGAYPSITGPYTHHLLEPKLVGFARLP
jgi:hypothetical protein